MVVLPDPLGPRKPVTRPGATSKLSPSTARRAPNSLERPWTSMADGMPDGTPAATPNHVMSARRHAPAIGR